MSRTAQDVLEFDKLRELLRLRTTSAPGRRAVNGLEPGMDRAALESAFALIREAAEWLRAGRELGFGALGMRKREKTTLRCATTASLFPCGQKIAGQFPAWCTEQARRDKRSSW